MFRTDLAAHLPAIACMVSAHDHRRCEFPAVAWAAEERLSQRLDNAWLCWGVGDREQNPHSCRIDKLFLPQVDALRSSPSFKQGDYEAALRECFFELDRRALGHTASHTAGATATVALVHGQDLYVAGVGDSRCVSVHV